MDEKLRLLKMLFSSNEGSFFLQANVALVDLLALVQKSDQYKVRYQIY